MKIKLLFLLSLVITSQILCAQVTKPMPTEEEWQTYFYAKKAGIQKKLYQLAIDGKIKAYKTDSLITIYKGSWKGEFYLNGNETKQISPFLDTAENTGTPHPLFLNEELSSGLIFCKPTVYPTLINAPFDNL